MASADHTPEIIEIPLTKGYVTVVDAVDADIADVKWRVTVLRGLAYAVRSMRNEQGYYRPMGMHRLIVARMLGAVLKPGQLVDHIDGDGLNNCRQNLRLATPQQSVQNRGVPHSNTSGVTGVYWETSRGKWHATIQVDQITKHLGRYSDFDEAVEARRAGEMKYFGEFAPSLCRRQS